MHHAVVCPSCAGEIVIVTVVVRDDDIASRLDRIEHFMTQANQSLQNLQAADQALKDEITTFLADIAARLANSPDPAAVQAVADDINAQVATLQAGDPNTPPPPPAPVG